MSKTRESFYLQTKELRTSTNGDGSKSIVGLIPYNSPSAGLPWEERIAPGAFANALLPDADVLLLRDHQQEKLLARTLSKTLTLEDTPVGLKFTANLSTNNSVALDTLDSIARRDLSGVSFGFKADKDAWADDGQGNVTRTLLSVTLYEISCTSFAAFPDSQVSLRSIPAEYRSLLDPDNDGDNDSQECNCPRDADGNLIDPASCNCADDDNDAEEWAERSKMRLALEQVRSYSHYIRNNY